MYAYAAFHSIELSRFAGKNLSEIRNGLEASPANEKLQKSIIFWVGCGYLSFGNPFGYENITRQAISKKIWKPNPNQTQPVFRYARIGQSKKG